MNRYVEVARCAITDHRFRTGEDGAEDLAEAVVAALIAELRADDCALHAMYGCVTDADRIDALADYLAGSGG